MRFIETAQLNDFIREAYSDSQSIADMYGDIEDQDIISLQKASFEKDAEYLREISSLLNAILSIIYHPHISNKTEDVILRVEQVGSLGSDEFRQILLDTQLWKRHGATMIPEEVHYRQHIDELKIYENRFIVLLVNLIDRELTKYNSFYVSKLPTFDSRSAALPRDEVGGLIVTIDRLKRRVQFIKSTYFYKVVSEGKPLTGKIRPTNILMHDRLYRHCFKFYRNYIRYEDTDAIKIDLRKYYVLLILRALKGRGFDLVGDTDGDVISFKTHNFDLTLELSGVNEIIMTVSTAGREIATHVLYVSLDDREDKAIGGVKTTTEEALSLWGLSTLDREQERTCASEKNLVRTWIDSKLRITKLRQDIYGKYCPVCRSRNVVSEDDEMHMCGNCTSEYVFVERGQLGNVWFRKIRK